MLSTQQDVSPPDLKPHQSLMLKAQNAVTSGDVAIAAAVAAATATATAVAAVAPQTAQYDCGFHEISTAANVLKMWSLAWK